jgi:hypothetical protein
MQSLQEKNMAQPSGYSGQLEWPAEALWQKKALVILLEKIIAVEGLGKHCVGGLDPFFIKKQQKMSF